MTERERQEREANAFAMELLMPEDWIRADCERNGLTRGYDAENDPRIHSLCERYKVSFQLMMFRLIDLGIIESY